MLPLYSVLMVYPFSQAFICFLFFLFPSPLVSDRYGLWSGPPPSSVLKRRSPGTAQSGNSAASAQCSLGRELREWCAAWETVQSRPVATPSGNSAVYGCEWQPDK